MHNFIIEFRDALPADYCKQLISKFERSNELRPGFTGAGVDTSKKDSVDLSLSDQVDWQEECARINGVVSRALALYAKTYPTLLTGAVSPAIRDKQTGKLASIEHSDLNVMDPPQIEQLAHQIFRFDAINMQRYTKGTGGYHHWHSEHYPHPDNPAQHSLHRVLLWLLYLNKVEQGGQTEFMYQQTGIQPTTGTLVLAPCGFTHSHRGARPISSDKYVLASWVMYKDASALYAATGR